MADDIVEFLTARLDEDERIGLGGSEGPRKPEEWVAMQWPYGKAPRDWAVDCPRGAVVVDGSFRATAEHIARHDPARVLADIAGKRRILGWSRGPLPDYEVYYVLTALAAPYANHPDYQPEWRVS